MDRLHTFEDPVLQHPNYQLDLKKINLSVKGVLLEIKAFCENNDYFDMITVDIWKLRNIVISWKHDINRLRAFHFDSSYPDKYKQAAYFIFWFVKTKPVIVTRPNPKRKYMAINEILAYHLGITRLLQIEPAKISSEKYDGFIYQFCYHNIDPKQLIPRLELLGAIP
jgi:hypothetical protein